jgi:thiol-disulfide isomerase/thioredoxin
MFIVQAVVVVLVGAFLALMIGTQVAVRRAARTMRGKAAPALPGAHGRAVAAGGRTLFYFHSPGCAACRPLTPRIVEASRRDPRIRPVDVAQDLSVAQALQVMATPSFVEIEDGVVRRYLVGAPPAGLLESYAGKA